MVDGEWCGEDGNVVDKDGRSIHRTESDWESERRPQPGTRTCDHRRAEERYRDGRTRGSEGSGSGGREARSEEHKRETRKQKEMGGEVEDGKQRPMTVTATLLYRRANTSERGIGKHNWGAASDKPAPPRKTGTRTDKTSKHGRGRKGK